MGPMIARLVIGQLLNTNISFTDLNTLLPLAAADENNDYNLDDLDCADLMRRMEKKFDPARPTLASFL